MEVNRRSFLGFLGGAVLPSVSAAPSVEDLYPRDLSIEEWDEGHIHHIRIETIEDLDLSVFFDVPSSADPKPTGSYFRHTVRHNRWLIPLEEYTPELSGTFEERMKIFGNRKGSHHTHIVHKCSKSGRERVGLSVTKYPLLLEVMRLLVPVRLLGVGEASPR